jgi:hypothetical protein
VRTRHGPRAPRGPPPASSLPAARQSSRRARGVPRSSASASRKRLAGWQEPERARGHSEPRARARWRARADARAGHAELGRRARVAGPARARARRAPRAPARSSARASAWGTGDLNSRRNAGACPPVFTAAVPPADGAGAGDGRTIPCRAFAAASRALRAPPCPPPPPSCRPCPWRPRSRPPPRDRGGCACRPRVPSSQA